VRPTSDGNQYSTPRPPPAEVAPGPSTVTRADCILVLDGGAVVECGTHAGPRPEGRPGPGARPVPSLEASDYNLYDSSRLGGATEAS